MAIEVGHIGSVKVPTCRVVLALKGIANLKISFMPAYEARVHVILPLAKRRASIGEPIRSHRCRRRAFQVLGGSRVSGIDKMTAIKKLVHVQVVSRVPHKIKVAV